MSARTAKTSWAAALASRKRAWRPLTAAEAKKHKRQVKADRERDEVLQGQRHRGAAGAGHRGQRRRPARAKALGAGPLRGALGKVWVLGHLQELPLPAAATAGAHRLPQSGQAGDRPARLSKETVKALRPLDIDAGPYRHAAYGYRVHSAMIRLAWAAESVPEKIRQLPQDEKRAARAAYNFLMASEESAYGDFVEKHNKFLEQEGKDEAPEQRRKRPLQFLETPGLESALWPNLYWTEAMCETSIRASDVRRQRRCSAADAAQDVGGPRPEQHRRRWRAVEEDSASEEAEDGADNGRQSIKKSFMKKVLGPIAGYAESSCTT